MAFNSQLYYLAIIFLVISLIHTFYVADHKIIKKVIYSKTFVIELMIVTLWSLYVYRKFKKDPTNRLAKKELVVTKHAVIAFIIAYAARLQLTLVPFWGYFLSSFY